MRQEGAVQAQARLRVGILGAARIAPHALVAPARRVGGVDVACVAARDGARAQAFARKQGIPRWCSGYAELVADPTLDAVYIALPNAAHCQWALAALAAGKHVLCEKPLACNQDEARALVDGAARTGRVLMEGFHNRYHPLTLRVAEIVRSGALGRLRLVEGIFRTPSLRRDDIRFSYALGGGATMDMGCYMVNLMRYVVGEEPEVVGAAATRMAPEVDRRMQATLEFAGGCRGRMDVEMKALRAPDVRLRVVGDKGSLLVINPILPQIFHRLRVQDEGGVRHEHVGRTATYDLQLAAFVRAAQTGAPVATDARDALANMIVIDAIYVRAGMRPRGKTPL